MWYPIFLCTFASLATALGGLIVILFKKISDKTMSICQGFAGGVMLTVSFLDMLPHCYNNSIKYMEKSYAIAGIIGLFVAGWVIGVLIESLVVPKETNEKGQIYTARKLAFITTAVIVMHNLPEGVLTIFSGINNPRFGLSMAFAIALHNLPEGIAIAAPVLYVTNSKSKAFLQSLFTGFAELFGGLIALGLFHSFINESFINGLLAIISGIMVQASICQLIPTGAKFSRYKDVFIGVLLGVIVMCLGMFII